MAAIAKALHQHRTAKRDYALIRVSYLLGCRVSDHTLELLESRGRSEAEAYLFPSPRVKGHLIQQEIGDVCRRWGRVVKEDL